MKETQRNHIGFLFSYDWLPMLDLLPAEEFKALFVALINRQRHGKPIPKSKNELTNAFAAMIEPTIQRRLNGQKGGLKTQKAARSKGAPSGFSEGRREGASEERP